MDNITLTLTVQDITNTLALINASSVSAANADEVVELKAKFRNALPQEKDEEQKD